MTSPYLNKPRRGLDQALRDRGMSRADVGCEQPARTRPCAGPARERSRFRRSRFRRSPVCAALGGGLVVGLVALGYALLTDPAEDVPAIAEEQIDALQEIAPAAGPANAGGADSR